MASLVLSPSEWNTLAISANLSIRDAIILPLRDEKGHMRRLLGRHTILYPSMFMKGNIASFSATAEAAGAGVVAGLLGLETN